ncbi:hypothetical protein TELCIR_18282, partial [Teladorsagia circumcincta]
MSHDCVGTYAPYELGSVDSYALEQTLEFIKSVMSSGDGAVCAIRELDWTYVHAIADTGSYGERGMDSFRAAATELGICIDGDVHKIGRRWTDKNFRDLLIHMHRTRKARGVVMFVDEDNLKRLLHTLDKLIKDGHTELDRHF